MFTWYTSLIENCQVLLIANCAFFSCHCSVTALHSQLDSRTTHLSTTQQRFLMLFGAGKQKMIRKETKQEQLLFKRKGRSLPGGILRQEALLCQASRNRRNPSVLSNATEQAPGNIISEPVQLKSSFAQTELILATTVPSSLYVTYELIPNVMLLRHTPF